MLTKKSIQFFYCCLFFIVGVAVGELFRLDWSVFLCLSGLIAILVILLKPWRFAILCCGFLLFGCFWNNVFNPLITADHLAFYNEQKKEFQGAVADEPVVQGAEQSLVVQPAGLRGKVLIKKSVYPIFFYGDELKIDCRLVSPKPVEDFRYDKYLAKQGVYSLCYNPEIKLLARDQGSWVLSGIFSLKNYLLDRLNKTLPEPQASLLAGILVGARASLPQDLQTDFNRVGVTHIIAISGYNITILVVVLLNLARSLYINRKKATWLVLTFLVFFVIFTGAGGSVVRAGIMGGLVVIAKYLGRKSAIRNVLVLSCALMLLVNPKILMWDAGFQLSFLSTIGLIYLSPKIERFFKWLPEFFSLRENFVSTMSAITITLPLILFNFGRLSLVAPLANILVLPVIPLIMFIGFWQMFVSAFSLLIGEIVGWGSWLFLTYVIKVVELFSNLSFAAVDLKISFWLMLFLYCLILIFTKFAGRRKKNNDAD